MAIDRRDKEIWELTKEVSHLSIVNRQLIRLTNDLHNKRDYELRKIAESRSQFDQPLGDNPYPPIILKINYVLTKAYNIRQYIELLELHLKYSKFLYNDSLYPIDPSLPLQEYHVLESQFIYKQRDLIKKEIKSLKEQHQKLIEVAEFWEKLNLDKCDDESFGPDLWEKINEQD